MPTPKLELLNKKFGELEALELVEVHPKYGTKWRCQCSCGNEHVVRGSHLNCGTITTCPDCSFRKRRNPNGVGDMSIHYWNNVLRGAKRRDIKISISKEEAYEAFLKQDGRCALTGVSLIFPPRTNRPNLGNASLDRRDSKLGYTKENIQWVHKIVNRLKMDLEETELLKWCERIVRHVSKVEKDVVR